MGQQTCYCAAYPFPHRMGGGECAAEFGQLLCEDCKLPATGVLRDMGIGSYEYWGQRCVDTDMRCVSKCCESSFVQNAPTFPEAEGDCNAD